MTRLHESLSYNITRAEVIIDMYKRSAITYEVAVKKIESLYLPDELKTFYIERLKQYKGMGMKP